MYLGACACACRPYKSCVSHWPIFLPLYQGSFYVLRTPEIHFCLLTKLERANNKCYAMTDLHRTQTFNDTNEVEGLLTFFIYYDRVMYIYSICVYIYTSSGLNVS